MMNSLSTPSLIERIVRDVRACWKELILTAVVYKIIAFVLLIPLVGGLFRFLIALSGSSVLSDVDIAYFFLRPSGLFCLIIIGALWLAIIALAQASLVGMVRARAAGQRLGVLGALQFAAAHAWPTMQVTVRIMAFILLMVAPILVVVAVTYYALLSEHDINYYLAEKPPNFIVALGIGAFLLVTLVCLVLRLVTHWFLALPLVLFERISPSQALRQSRERTLGHRRSILGLIVVWALATMILSAATTGGVGLAGRLLIPESTSSLRWLQITIGAMLLLWAFVSLTVNLLSTISFACLLFNVYKYHGCPVGQDTRLEIAPSNYAGSRFRITLKRMIAAGVVGVMLAASIGVAAVQSVRLEDHVEIMAHRGSSKAAPENSMAAIKKAIEEGADWVEIDVQETADGEVVVLHDSDFMKLAGRNLKIWNATMSDLKEIDIGSRFAAEFRDERVPTLAQVLNECKGKIGVNIELKYYGHDKELEQRVADVIESCGMATDVMLMSLEMKGVRKMKALRPNWKVGLLMSVAAGELNKINADFLAVNVSFASPSFVRAAHASGKEVYVWTVNDAATMSTVISRGVDGLLTDKPALARVVLEQRAHMSGPERLLLEVGGWFGAKPEIAEQ